MHCVGCESSSSLYAERAPSRTRPTRLLSESVYSFFLACLPAREFSVSFDVITRCFLPSASSFCFFCLSVFFCFLSFFHSLFRKPTSGLLWPSGWKRSESWTLQSRPWDPRVTTDKKMLAPDLILVGRHSIASRQSTTHRHLMRMLSSDGFFGLQRLVSDLAHLRTYVCTPLWLFYSVSCGAGRKARRQLPA